MFKFIFGMVVGGACVFAYLHPKQAQDAFNKGKVVAGQVVETADKTLNKKQDTQNAL